MLSSALSLLGRRSPGQPPLLPDPDPAERRGEKRTASSPPSPVLSETTISNEERTRNPEKSNAALQKDIEELRDLLDYQATKIMVLEAQVEHNSIAIKASNIILYGVPEDLDFREVANLFAGEARLPTLNKEIATTRRLGQATSRPSTRPRPLLLKFASISARRAAFQHAKRLRERGISMADDLTKKQLNTKKERIPDFQMLHARGCHPFWRGDKIFFRANGSTKEWIPGSRPPGPPPQAPTTQPPAAPSGSKLRGKPPQKPRAHPSRAPDEIQPCEDQPGAAQPPSWAGVTRPSRATTHLSGPPTTAPASGATDRPNAPRHTAAASAGVDLGARPQPAPRGRPAAAHAGQGPGVTAADNAATAPPMPPSDYEAASEAEPMDWQMASNRRRAIPRKAAVGDGHKRQALPPRFKVATHNTSHSRYLALEAPTAEGSAGPAPTGHVSS